MLAGYLGGFIRLFDISADFSFIIVGAGWPTILPRIVALSRRREEEEQRE